MNRSRECIIGVSRVLLASVVASLLLAPLLAFINVMRNYGNPGDMAAVSQASVYAASNPIAAMIDSYNSSMSGYGRFGSGIGMIGGAFWAMGYAKSYSTVARIMTGLPAGFVIGARAGMMITSDAHIVIASGVIGAVWTAVYLYIAGLPSKFKPLPNLELKP